MYKFLSRPLLLIVAILLSSCQKEDDLSVDDYSIRSDSGLQLISQHPNGWIKKAETITSLSSGNHTTEEFEYFENGLIKSAKLYRINPTHHLYMEVSRSEDNKPLWSKYYTPEGKVWLETQYEEGLPSIKKVFSEEGTAIHNYHDGALVSIGFTSADHNSSSLTTFDAEAGKRIVSISNDGQTVLHKEYPFQEQVGTGFYSKTYVPVANPFDGPETIYRDKNWGKSLLSAGGWEDEADPLESLMLPYRLPAGHQEYGGGFDTQLAVSSNMYQSIIEQYPVTENGILIAGGYSIEGFDEFSPNFIIRDSLAKVKEEDPRFFELKYGQEIIEKVNYGKSFIVIGALRNLPTDKKVAEKIRTIAEKRLNELRGHTITMMDNNKIELIQGEVYSLTSEEKEILDKVWFEVKFFSNLKAHQNGLVIDAAETYKKAIDAINEAEPAVINLKYRSINSY